MECPLVVKLWREKYPEETGVDYDDDVSVWENIPKGWWFNHDVCKYILSFLIHKDNKDITTRQRSSHLAKCTLRQGAGKKKALEVERAVAKADPPVKKHGDVDHQIKKI